MERAQRESGLARGQIQLWMGQKLAPESPLYNMAFAFSFDGAIQPEAFAEAWRQTTTAHEVIRTSIAEQNGIPARHVLPLEAVACQHLDFTTQPNPKKAFQVWAQKRARIPLPLNGPLAECFLAQLSPHQSAWYLNQHHMITDAASDVIVFQELAERYQALLSNHPSPPIQPSDYQSATANLAKSVPENARQEARAHWQSRFSQEGRTTPFYGNSNTPDSDRTRRRTLTLNHTKSTNLRDLSESDTFLSFTPQISSFAIFATILSAWLHRVGGQDDVSFDAPTRNRPTPEARTCPGLFIELLPFAVSIDPGESFRTLGEKCLSETNAFLRNAIPESSSPSADTIGNVVLNFVSASFGPFAGIPTTVDWIHSGHGDRFHALRIQIHDFDESGEYSLHFDFNEEIFPPERQEDALQHFETLLEHFLENLDAPIDAVDLLTPEERTRTLVEFNETSSEPLPKKTLVSLFKESASRFPDHVALREKDKSWSFTTLEQESAALAKALEKQGVGPGNTVVVFMKRSASAVLAILAVLRSGAAYVPVDPRYPKERVQDILENSGARVALTTTASPPLPKDTSVKSLNIEKLDATDKNPPAPHPSPDNLPLEALAYIIYTSGSTGKPKGVPITHAGLADYITWAARQYIRGEQLAFPLFTSLSFDLTVTSLFLPLITGGTLHVYEEPEGPVDSAFMDVIGENAVDFIKLTPSHLSLLRQVNLENSRLRRMVVGGEDFKTHLAKNTLEQIGPQLEIYNEYGPTEAVVGCMIHRFDPETDQASSVPIGKPADHVQLYVLNDSLTPVPEGVPGELGIARHGLAQGYHHAPELSAKQFVQNPFAKNQTLYRSGDLVRFKSPGVLDYLGRIDRQIKISGHRIEPGEIEHTLVNHPAIREAVVTAHQGHSSPPPNATLQFCNRCGLPSNYPGATYNDHGLCNICQDYDAIKEHAADYFGTPEELLSLIQESFHAASPTPEYHCMALLSGGKDSTYALAQLVDRGLKVYAFSFDNGYISEQAIANIQRVVDALKIDHEFATTPAINAIFKDSLTRFSNVCNGCFKTIYTLAVNRARELNIPVIVTGLSRGQLFETRLTPNLFRDGRCPPEEIDSAVLAARKAYHRLDDEVFRSLDVSAFANDEVFKQIRFLDFYRYCDVDLDEVMSYLNERLPWVRPSDTGRSTNCQVNDVGIYIHNKERGFHNYALPYSWDVRMGHKSRKDALAELDDELDLNEVRTMLDAIGYDENRLRDDKNQRASLVAYYVTNENVPDTELRHHLTQHLPDALLPTHFIPIESIPLTTHGKVDLNALPAPDTISDDSERAFSPPEGPAEEEIAAIWTQALERDRVGAENSFFQLGGTSLAAMDVMWRISDHFQVDLPLQSLFQNPTVRDLAALVESLILEELADLTDEEAEQLAREEVVDE